MSHFSTLVVTKEKPTLELLAVVLQPWHEFECTGADDQYVQNVDKLPELLEKFETANAVLVIEFPDGTHLYAFNEQGNYIDALKPYYDSNDRKLNLPEGYKEHSDLPAKQFMSFAQYANSEYGFSILEGTGEPDLKEKHKYGWIRVVDGQVTEVFDRTNPNKKWDWWTVGGRYKDRLMDNFPRKLDSCQVSELDLAGMKKTAEDGRRKQLFDIVLNSGLDLIQIEEALSKQKFLADMAWETLPEPRPRGGAYAEWLKMNGWNEFAAVRNCSGSFYYPDVQFGQTLEEWVTSAIALSCWAFVIDGTWNEKGEMGWFGVSHGDKDDWDQTVQGMLATLQPTDYITVVDCHI